MMDYNPIWEQTPLLILGFIKVFFFFFIKLEVDEFKSSTIHGEKQQDVDREEWVETRLGAKCGSKNESDGLQCARKS